MLRIKELRIEKNITQDQMVERTGIKKRSYVDYENEKSDVKLSHLQKIASVLDVSIQELLEKDETLSDIVSETPEKYEIIKNQGVPYFDIDFTASFLEVENNQQTQPDSYISHPFFKDSDIVVRASGQSMAKLIKHGDAIGLKRIIDWVDFIPMGEIYAIVTKNNFRMIKIITKGETNKSYTLISKPTDSKKNEFPPQQINKDQILSIFKVQACAHLF